MDICWWLSQEIPGTSHETEAKNHVRLNGYHDYSNFSDGQHTDFDSFKLIKRTNLDIKDTVCLHIINPLQHLTSRPTSWSTHATMISATKENTVHRVQRANMANWQNVQHDNVIKRINARAGWKQTQSEPLGHYAAYDPKHRLWRRKDAKCTCYAMPRKGNGYRNMFCEKPLLPEREFKTQRQRFGRSMKIWFMLILLVWHLESTKKCLRRWWLLSETVWAIFQVQMMRRMGMVRTIRFRAGQAEQRWQTWLGGGHDVSNLTTVRGEVMADVDEAWRIDTARMGPCAQLLAWKG